jgi:uncharacterized protein
MVVIEAMKAAYNRGVEPRLSFYRDKSGLEIDLIREYQRRPYAVEIKAGMTLATDMLGSLKRFRTIISDLHGAALIYSGDKSLEVSGVRVVNHTQTAELLFGE